MGTDSDATVTLKRYEPIRYICTQFPSVSQQHLRQSIHRFESGNSPDCETPCAATCLQSRCRTWHNDLSALAMAFAARGAVTFFPKQQHLQSSPGGTARLGGKHLTWRVNKKQGLSIKASSGSV